MLNLILFQPEIPSNTGNLIRLSSNMGANLHLIKPYGFEINDKRLKRASLDYQELAKVYQYQDFADYLAKNNPTRIFAVSSKASTNYAKIDYKPNDCFLFGSETKGLPDNLLAQYQAITIPMKNHSRSLNLSNAVAILAYEVWRQFNFKGAKNA
jgi:tRNA (cytidine/uridine-2'-O-)-methyltransferase